MQIFYVYSVVNSAMSLYPQSAGSNAIGSCWRQDSTLLDPAGQQDPMPLSPFGGKKNFINLFFYLLYEKKLNKKKEKNLKKQKKIGNIWRPNQTQ